MKKWQIGWGTIADCNMKCVFCYSEKVRQEKKTFTNYVDWVNFIDENNQYIEAINYGTGENSMSLEWFDLISYVRNKYPEISQALTSNGYIIKRIQENSVLEKIVLDSLDEIDISLDYSDYKKHNNLRQNNYAYDWAIEALNYFKNTKMKMTIVFIGLKSTVEKNNLDGLFKIAKENNAILRMNLFRPVNGFDKFVKENLLKFHEIKKALYYIEKKYNVLQICDPLFSSIFTENSHKIDPSGENSIRILADGSITPSTYLISENFRKANIKETNVLQKVHENETFKNIMGDKIPNECLECELSKTCKGGVYDRRYLWYDKFDVKDPYCPEGCVTKYNKIKIKNTVDFSSIHDGYLPTFFFSN